MRFQQVLSGRYFELFVDGFTLALQVAAAAIALGLVLGVVTAVARMSGFRVLRMVAGTYIEIIRNTPALIQIFLIYYGLPELGIRLPAIPSLILALGINSGAYLAEIFRGGLQSVKPGQLEAAAALALPARTAFFGVVLPQAIRGIWPAITNVSIQVVLATSLGTIVGVPELTNQAMYINSRSYRTWEVLIVLSLAYFALSLIITAISRIVAWRMDRAYR